MDEYGEYVEMVSRREEIVCKYPRTPIGEECCLTFSKKENNQCSSYSEQQHTCPFVPSENVIYGRQETNKFKQGHSKISDTEADHNYYGIFLGILKTRADWQSHHRKDFLEWKLSPMLFQYICQKMEIPMIDLLAYRLSN